MRPLAPWAPPLAWMAVILLLSSELASARETSRFLTPLLGWLVPWATPLAIEALHGLLRKVGHLAEYAVLAALWLRALRHRGWSPRRAGPVALAIALAWAAGDEAHQSFLASRTGHVGDVVLDGAGALAAVLLVRSGWRRAASAATGVALWVAAAGGALALGVNALAGVPSGALWITVPVAGLALVLRQRRRR